MILIFWMKKVSQAFSLLLTLTIVITWLFLDPAACKAQGSPRIKVDKKIFDFGVIYRGNSAEGDFIIHNEGNDTLRIKNVRSSCGCTAAILDKKNLGPNEQTKLNASLARGVLKAG